VRPFAQSVPLRQERTEGRACEQRPQRRASRRVQRPVQVVRLVLRWMLAGVRARQMQRKEWAVVPVVRWLPGLHAMLGLLERLAKRRWKRLRKRRDRRGPELEHEQQQLVLVGQ
jgi:hypothetical protein